MCVKTHRLWLGPGKPHRTACDLPVWTGVPFPLDKRIVEAGAETCVNCLQVQTRD